jgi:hypothetical protein
MDPLSIMGMAGGGFSGSSSATATANQSGTTLSSGGAGSGATFGAAGSGDVMLYVLLAVVVFLVVR